MPSPIVTTTLQAGALSALSNILAQLITCWQSNTPYYKLNIIQLLQFVTFSIVANPPNYIWQAYLERKFPAHANHPSPTEKKERLVDDTASSHSTGVEKHAHENGSNSITYRRPDEPKTTTGSSGTGSNNKAGKLSIKNTAIKFTLDQTLGATVNTILFIAGMALLRGQSWPTISHAVQEQFWPMMFAGQKLWPAVSILSFSIVPLEHRMLFGSVAGLFWGVYLSLVAGSNNKKA